ncbi:hypothetical protein [Actinokineospora bangkokensis]|uniref:Uncharacterized protein n=1 Tax=Actinokineospora bangkokensis TaxID=1193682 RepID=A0A1Q9LI71_9PSEU|nr:hypothetical protein [Actinokineospora bangkokensis]OLR91747.1 hypothetical protein BJP25_24770 [Actinokineospora bangkokensis]
MSGRGRDEGFAAALRALVARTGVERARGVDRVLVTRYRRGVDLPRSAGEVRRPAGDLGADEVEATRSHRTWARGADDETAALPRPPRAARPRSVAPVVVVTAVVAATVSTLLTALVLRAVPAAPPPAGDARQAPTATAYSVPLPDRAAAAPGGSCAGQVPRPSSNAGDATVAFRVEQTCDDLVGSHEVTVVLQVLREDPGGPVWVDAAEPAHAAMPGPGSVWPSGRTPCAPLRGALVRATAIAVVHPAGGGRTSRVLSSPPARVACG